MRAAGVRHGPTQRGLTIVVAALGLIVVAGCASRTKVELDSASAPIVEPVDGAGENDVDVVDAGVVEIDEGSATATTEAVQATSSTAASTTSTDEPATTQTTVTGTADPAFADECEADRTMLERAVANFRADNGVAPASEAELVVDSYLRRFSQLYDVQYNGAIVTQGKTCVGAD